MTALSIAGSCPSLVKRLQIFFRHAGRVLFLPYGGDKGYSFDDLAACQDSIDGPSFQNIALQMANNPSGRRVLRERPTISMQSIDWDYLKSLDTQSLGYNFWYHLNHNGILEEVVLEPSKLQYSSEVEFAKKRFRETHDIRHVILGVGISGEEEVILSSFQFAQQSAILPAAIVVGGLIKHCLFSGHMLSSLRRVKHAFEVGRNSTLLNNLYFEELWSMPLEEVRQMCGVEPTGECYPVQ